MVGGNYKKIPQVPVNEFPSFLNLPKLYPTQNLSPNKNLKKIHIRPPTYKSYFKSETENLFFSCRDQEFHKSLTKTQFE